MADNDDLIEEVERQLDNSELAIILPIEDNDDETITCTVCGLHKCEFAFVTLGRGSRRWHGIHAVCSEPYLITKGREDESNFS